MAAVLLMAANATASVAQRINLVVIVINVLDKSQISNLNPQIYL
jgi:hypothetical protein